MSVGAPYVREQVHKLLGDKAGEFLSTPNPGLDKENPTPEEALNSGCPACIGAVLDLAEAM